MPPNKKYSICLYAFVLASFSYAFVLVSNFANAAPALTAGTLTCTLKPEPGMGNALACNYRPVGGGAEAKLKGELVRMGSDKTLDTTRVLVWLVVGPPKIELGDLEATFVRKNPTDASVPEQFREALIGGTANQIALVPPSGKEQIPGNAALAVVELNLKSIRI